MSKYICIFEPSHKLQTEQKLIYHLQKCKAQEKQSYQCCRYNALHWVKWNTIQQHQENCPSKRKQNNDFTKLLPNQISKIQFTIPFEADMSVVIQENGFKKQKNQNMKKVETIPKPKIKQTTTIKKKQQSKPKLWQQPDFNKFLLERGYKIKQKMVTSNGLSIFDQDSSMAF